MPVIQPRNEVANPGVGTNPVPQGASRRPSAWTRFTAVCSRIAQSFISDSGRASGQLPCGNPVPVTDSAQQVIQVKMLVDDRVVKRVKKGRITTRTLRKAGPEFKAGILAFHKNLQRTLPTIVEKNEYLKPPQFHSMRSGADTAIIFESTDSSVSNSRGDASQGSGSALNVGKQQACGSQRIVDYVPSNFPATRQQMLVNFRGKVIANNFKDTGLLNIHNEAALSKLLKTLEQAVSDKSVVALDALTPSQANSLFERFCEELKVSPLIKGFGKF